MSGYGNIKWILHNAISLIVIGLIILMSVHCTYAYEKSTVINIMQPKELPSAGDTFDVQLSISGNPGLNSLQMKLIYDENIVKCESVRAGDVIKDMLFAVNERTDNEGSIGAMISAASLDTVTDDGTIAVFRFSVLNNADPQLSLSNAEITDETGAKIPYLVKLSYTDENSSSVDTGTAVQDTDKQQSEIDVQPAQNPIRFTDVKEKYWAYSYISRAAKEGLVTGYNDGTFRPDTAVTRAQFVTMLWRMAGSPDTIGSVKFNDVAENAWYAKAVCWASENGYVNGTSEILFNPDGNITREQAAAIIFRYSGAESGMEVVLASAYDNQFTDSTSISPYAKQAVYWAIYNDIVTGITDTEIAPKATATRAQIAVIFLRYIDKNN